jgi:uncharacterized protein (DUF1697 family)
VPLRVALLRGINVAGNTRIGMADLRELLSGLGHTEVATYLQSGNAVFRPAGGGDARTAARLAAEIEARFGVKVSVLLRTGAELGRVLDGNPYPDQEKDPTKLHVTFLEREPAGEQAAPLRIPAGETATYTLAGREVYVHCPDGYGRTKLNNAYLERCLGVPATTRNWKTVKALHEMAQD